MSVVLGEADGANALESQIYWERGLSPGSRFGAHAKAWGGQTDLPGASAALEAEAGLKVRVLTFGPAVAAVQAAAGLRRPSGSDEVTAGGELRVMAGAAALQGGLFFNAEAGVRQFGAGAEPRAEATLGVRPHAEVLALAQLRRDEGPFGFERNTAEAAFVWFARPSIGLQVGWRADLDGGGGAITLGLWRRPGS